MAALQNRTLRWTTPGLLNDPYDMHFDRRVDINPERVRELALQKMWEVYIGEREPPIGNRLSAALLLFRDVAAGLTREDFNRGLAEGVDQGIDNLLARVPELQAQLRDEIRRSKILCLSEVPDSTLMWAHYAEDHRGLVLCFRSIEELDSPWKEALPINYVEHMPLLFDDEFLADMLSGRVAMDARAIMNSMIYTKQTHWSYEKEHRIFTGRGRDEAVAFEDVQFGARELDAVVFGFRMPQASRRLVSDLLRDAYPHVERFEAVLANDQFGIGIRPLR